MAVEERRNVCVAPLVRARDLVAESVSSTSYSCCASVLQADSPLRQGVTYQSPLPVFRPLLPSLEALPAAAEAKLDVNGEGIVVCFVLN